MRGNGRSPVLGLPTQPYGVSKGNPRLGRETAKEKAVRTRAFREQNLLMKEEKLHVEGSVLEALGHSRGTTDGVIRQSRGVDIGLVLDSFNNPSFWR